MAYDKHSWGIGEKITADRMNAIELGIQAAAAKADTSVQLTLTDTYIGYNSVDDIGRAIESIKSKIGTGDIGGPITSVIASLNTAILQGTNNGVKAVQELRDAGVGYSQEGNIISPHLKDIYYKIEDALRAWLTPDATDKIPIDGVDLPIATLANRITHIYNRINKNSTDIDSIQHNNDKGIDKIWTTISNIQTDIGLSAVSTGNRLAALDGNPSSISLLPSMHVLDIIKELEDAHSSTALATNGSNRTYNDIDERFETIEGEIVAAHITNGATLDARFDNIDGGSQPSRTLPDVISEIGTAHRTVYDTLNDRFNAIDNANQSNTMISRLSELETNFSNASTDLDSRLDTVEETLNGVSDGTASGLSARMTAAEIDIDNLEAADTALDGRLDAIDGGSALSTINGTLAARVAALESEVDMASTDGERRLDDIEGRLDDIDDGTNTMISGINDTISTIAGELGMFSETDTTSGTRIDNIESAISHVASGNDAGGLTERLTAVETEISGTNGITDRLDAIDDGTNTTISGLDSRLDAIDGGSALDITNGTLAARVTSLESKPKSATEVITSDYIEYDNNGIPTIYTSNSTHNNSTLAIISADKDYLLLQGNKYYYWKYIQTGSNPNTFAWAKISGDGAGSGNTSGYDLTAQEYATLVNNEEYEENTDYYVIRTDGVHHYRYVPVLNVLTEIEIGNIIDTTQIKRYNATTSVTGEGDEEVTYLDLYEFNYGVDNTVIDPLASTLRAHIPLPKGGSGSNNNITARLVRIGDETIQTIVNSNKNLYLFFSAWDLDLSYSGNYTLKFNNTVIDTGVFASGDINATPINWIVVEEPEFNNDVPVINSPDSTKLYIVKVGDTYTQWSYENNTWSSVAGAPAGFYALNISEYCKQAKINNTFALSVSYGENISPVGKTWKLNVYDLYLESTAPDTLLINSSDTYSFTYTPYGAIEKTLHVIIDDPSTYHQTVSLSSRVSGTSSTYTIPAQLHGAHTIEMYLTASIGGINQRTDSIRREYIWYNENDTTTPIILASQYNNLTITASQYSTIEIPYQVYKKNADTINVEYYLDDEVAPFGSVTLTDTNTGVLTYLATDDGNHTLTITVDDISISINLVITALPINVAPIDDAVIDFDPTTLTNSSVNRLPTWGSYSLTASPNFNWSEDISGGGYKDDVDGKCFVIKAGSYVDLNYKMFETKNNKTVFDNGAEIKVVFKTAAVRNADAVWFDNTGLYNDKTVGIQLGAHVGWLKTDKASDTSSKKSDTLYDEWTENTVYPVGTIVRIGKTIYQCITSEGTDVSASLQDDEDAWDEYLKLWLKLGELDTEVLSTNSYLYLPYSEKDKIELDININKYESGSANNFIMSYEDGVPSKAYAYTYGVSGDGVSHTNGIRIGSQDCDVYIYRLRIYNKSLSTGEILQNFIADGRDINEKVNRYNKNCIYWDSTQGEYFTSYNLPVTATLDPVKLAEQLPDVKILMLDTPRFTTGKKDFVKNSTLRCIHALGGKVYASRGDADNWFFLNGFHAGQGTTSDNYGQSARNVDFLFEVDATHWPTKEKNIKKAHTPSADYVSSVIVGEKGTKWNEDTETWVPTSIWDEVENKWVPNENILSAEEIQNWTAAIPDKCLDWKGDECKIDLTANSIPNNYFNLKVNVASSENVNNALFQERYNEFLNKIYESPAYKYSNKIKNDMEFVPAILFLRENDTTIDSLGNYTKHNEFNDTKWHFYALGNIGDSKKTDYTRAYNPKDMNEFTVENSDNNTNNGQFQSGVFIYNDHRAIETDYSAWSNTTPYNTDDIVVYDGGLYIRTGEDLADLGENETYSWVAVDWAAVTYTGWTDQDPPYFAPRTNPNPMDYVYPITPSQWNIKMGDNFLNRKHQTLVSEKFDGDHSFEFRYACMGDYRDGDLINDTTGFAKAQEKTNHQKVLDFYEWLVTATEEDYEDEASDWFIPEAMEFFYAFTHYYTMMDNRAKNTFWHWAKHYISSNDANGTNYNAAAAATVTAQETYDAALADLADVESVLNPIIALAEADIAAADVILLEDSTDAEALAQKEQATLDKATAAALVAAAQAIVDNAKSQLVSRTLKRDELKYLYDNADCFIVDNTAAAINDGRRFDLWAYDMDTAVGIDNNGALVFPYGKEDEDYRVEGEASSGYAFNGAGSIFWRRLKNTFADGVRTVMNDADVNCFNSENLIDQFDKFQNCFPEEIWRLDIERKYIRTFTGKSVDNSITKGKLNPRFLTSMMQGRKKYQRRLWVRDLGVYFNSKYRLTDIIRNENTIEFNIITPTNPGSLAVTPNYNLKLTPYQDMYLNVQVGNGNYLDLIRAKAGVEYTMNLAKNTSGTFQETRIYINGFNSISGISNLAPMYPYSFTLSALEHLKVLNLGTDNAGYRNANFTSLPFEETTLLPLLETLNIKNCNSLTGTIKLNTANNIRTIEAVGSGITGVILPDYTNILTLHLPSTVSALSLYGARSLTDFYMKNISGTEDYSGLYTLHLYDSDYSTNVHWIDIALAMIEKESTETNLLLLRLSAATIGNIETLEPIKEFKETLETIGKTIELSGTIHVTGDWSLVEKDSYAGLSTSTWPNLTLDTTNGQYQQKHKVTYIYSYLDDNNYEVQGNEIKTIYIDNEAPLIDIWQYTDQDTQLVIHILDEMPHVDHTVRSNYQFGKRLYGNYVEFSGWKEQGATQPISVTGTPLVTSNLIIETYFERETRAYPIKWYLKKKADGTPDNDYLVHTSRNPVPYGGGQEEEIPTVLDIHTAGFATAEVSINSSNATYSIFNGWEKTPININPTINDDSYNICANWTTPTTITLPTLYENIDNLSPELLLVLSAMNSSAKNTYTKDKIGVGKEFTYTMGYDNNSGQELIGPNTANPVLRLDIPTTSVITTSIQPMAAANDAFTIAIDYCIDPNATYAQGKTAAILASCYSIDNISNTVTGFALYNSLSGNTGMRVGFGNMFGSSALSVSIGRTSTLGLRNIVVLRHPAGSDTLYIYSGLGTGNSLNTSVTTDSILWNDSTTDAYLNFGQLTNSNSSDYAAIKTEVARAQGTIYWAKYWPLDLGVGECKMIAAWPHEPMTFKIAELKDTPTSGSRAGTSQVSPSINLVAMNTSAHGKVVQDRANTTAGSITGWGTSVARTICNNRVFFGLPIKLQSILCKPNIYYKNLEVKVDPSTSMNTYTLGNNNFVRDYIYLPTATNLISATTEYTSEEQNTNMRPYSWFEDSASVEVYNYDTTVSGKWATSSESNITHYYNLRFTNYPIKWSNTNKLRIFKISGTDIASNTTIYAEINNNVANGIKYGDVFISSSGIAYIYISNNDIINSGILNEPNQGIFTTPTGGWLASSEYWTRSMGYNATQNNYVYVEQSGSVNLSETRSANTNGLKLNYAFEI